MPTRREEYDLKLAGLEREAASLADYVSDMINRSVEALKGRDLAASQQVIDDDDIVDLKHSAIEDQCVHLIATQQPVAGDLRAIISLLHIGVELERIGDYAEGIGKISLAMGDEKPLKPLIDIPRMADKAREMLHGSIESLLDRDTVRAEAVCRADDEVDALYDQVYRELLLYMIEDPRTIRQATYLLWVAHDLERIADRATNIAEQVVFLVTGRPWGSPALPSEEAPNPPALAALG